MEEHIRLLISAKAVICHDGGLVLVLNSRGEWDLPGGKLQNGESIEGALRRELKEELTVDLVSFDLLSAELHHHYDDILVLVYGCEVEGAEYMTTSEEHIEVRLFPIDSLPLGMIPAPYVQPIRLWVEARGT